MKQVIGRTLAVLCFGLILFTGSGNDGLKLQSERLESIRGEIEELRSQLERFGEKKESLLAGINELETRKRLRKMELKEYGFRIRELEGDISERLEMMEKLEGEIANQKIYISRRLREIYKLGRLNYLRLVLSMDDPGEMLRGYKYLSLLARKNSRKLGAFKSNLVELEDQSLKLTEEKEKLTMVKSDASAKKRELERSGRQLKKALQDIEEDEEIRRRALNELERAEKSLESFIADIGKGEKRDLSTVSFPSIEKFKGLLPWPSGGRIALSFGKVKHPKFNTVTLHKGIDIQAASGADILAVYDGNVVFCDWFEGYGKTVIIDHNEGYFTVYAHASKLFVNSGDFVTKGRKIAEVGETGSLKGPFLYFELRNGTEALNPMDWLEEK